MVVDSRFDLGLGLLITVELKQQEFKGMLYYPPRRQCTPAGSAGSHSAAQLWAQVTVPWLLQMQYLCSWLGDTVSAAGAY